MAKESGHCTPAHWTRQPSSLKAICLCKEFESVQTCCSRYPVVATGAGGGDIMTNKHNERGSDSGVGV